jgi:chemotaxis protein CheX
MMSATTPAVISALPPVLDLAAADALCRTLREGLALDDLMLDGRAVERVSTPCLQLLLSAAMSASAQGARFRIASPSDALSTAIAELGLGELIPLEH